MSKTQLTFLQLMLISVLIAYVLFNILIPYSVYELKPYELLLALNIQGENARLLIQVSSCTWGVLIFMLLRKNSYQIMLMIWKIWIAIHLFLVLWLIPDWIDFTSLYVIFGLIVLINLFALSALNKKETIK